MFPSGTVIAGPDQGVALHPGIARACDYERPLRFSKGQRALTRGARHLRSVNVVRFLVREWSDIALVQAILGERLRGEREVRRFIHVVPDARDSNLVQRGLFLGPPGTDAGIREIRENRFSGPDLANEIGFVVGVAHKRCDLLSAFKNAELAIRFHARINDRHHLETLPGEAANHRRRLRKRLAKGEHAIAIHVVDIEVKGITRNLALAEFPGD